MLFAVSGLIGCSVEASGARVGAIKDFLFDAENWKIRWLEVDLADRLASRKALIRPSAIAPLDVSEPHSRLPMLSFQHTPTVSLRLTKQQIEAGPAAPEDAPVTKEIENRLCAYYGLDPEPGGDPRLLSAVSVRGCRVHATDGDLGHVENLLADTSNGTSATWSSRRGTGCRASMWCWRPTRSRASKPGNAGSTSTSPKSG